MYYIKGRIGFSLIELKYRYEEKMKNSVKLNDRKTSVVKEKYQSELETLGFQSIDELIDNLKDPNIKMLDKRRDVLTDFYNRYKKSHTPASLVNIIAVDSSAASVVQDAAVFSTYNVKYKYSERNGKALRELSGKILTDYKDFVRVMSVIYNNRKSAETCYNERSSRSHLIITLKITRESLMSKAAAKVVKVNLVDLAGSENASKIGCERIDETISTNKSLLVLKKCIKALSNKEKKSSSFPFREALLTKILQDSLAGLDNKLILIGTISCQNNDFHETNDTLRYSFKKSYT